MEQERVGRRPLRARPVAVAVSLRGLTKSYGPKRAVDALDLDVPAGSFFGLVGPNGAGKSTTLRMATGLLRPDAGTVTVCDVDVWANPLVAKAQIGVLTEDLRLFDRLSAEELLSYNGLLRSMDTDVIKQRSDELLEVLGLEHDRGNFVIDFSQGMRKKIALACALLHAPKVLFLDEPFESVDPISSRTIRTVLEHYTESGGTVVFSSHVMETVERLCDHVGIIHAGRLVAEGPTAQLLNGQRLEDVFFRVVGATADDEASLSWLGTSRA
ncbi:MAG TPA: ABC transporter ATP-binding protein [Acidimicrobiales bacterium]|nr:ABC transporter ATP-binding protein [Acidimicrobiales bacterium]